MKSKKYLAGVILVVFVLMLASFARPVQAAGSVSYEDIDAYMEKQLSRLNVPGASWVIVEGDQIVHTSGFGTAGSGGEAPTPQTPYFIGSLTKSVTALAVMQLVEEGAVELDAPVQQYLPWFTMADAEAAAQITVRNLLVQTSGISQLPGMIGLANFDDAPGGTERQARSLADDGLSHPVGTKWEYSNVNFNLLGLVIEAASGQSYADYVAEHIFAPLQMEHSYMEKAAAQQDGLALGHMQWFGFPVPVPGLGVPAASLPSGQIIASVEDMGHYLIAHMNQGEYEGVRVLSAEGVVQMHQPAVQTGTELGWYGMGWFVKEISAGNLVFHYGEVPDGFAYMALLPEQERGLVLLVNTNQQAYTFTMLAMAEEAALMLAGIPPQPGGWGILPWALRALLLLPVLQGVLIFAGLRRIQGWQSGERSLPGRTRLWLVHILLPSLVNLLLAAGAIAILASGMLKFIMLFMGDIASVVLLCGGVSLVWLVMRTVMMVRVLR